MRIVQALHWLKDTLPTDRDRILARLSSILADPRYGKGLRDDLRTGLPTLPAWMQDLVRELLSRDHDHPIPRVAGDATERLDYLSWIVMRVVPAPPDSMAIKLPSGLTDNSSAQTGMGKGTPGLPSLVATRG